MSDSGITEHASLEELAALAPSIVPLGVEAAPEISIPATNPADLKCPMCGWRHGDVVNEVPSSDDKLEFRASLLGERRFEKEYSVFGGAIVYRFRTLMQSELDNVRELLRACAVEAAKNTDVVFTPQDWQLMETKLMLMLRLQHVYDARTDTKVDFAPRLKELSKDNWDSYWRTLTQTLTGALIETAVATNSRFDALERNLKARAYDADFWLGLNLQK